MKTAGTFIGWIVGMFIGFAVMNSIPFLGFVCIIGGPILGRKIGASIDESKEEERRREDDRKRREYQRQREEEKRRELEKRKNEELARLSRGEVVTYPITERGKEIQRKKIQVVAAASTYPHAFYALVQRLAIRNITGIEQTLPGSRKSNRAKRVERESRKDISPIAAKFVAPVYVTGINVVSDRKNQTKRNISSLRSDEYEKLYDYIGELAQQEREITRKLAIEDNQIAFDDKVLDNPRRAKYYSQFLSDSGRNLDDHDFIVRDLSRLDSFIEQTISNDYLDLKRQFPLGVKQYCEEHRISGSLTTEQKERILASRSEIKKLNEVRKKYDELAVKYPNGLPAFERWNSYDDGKNSAELTIEEIIECEEAIAEFEQNYAESQFYSDWLNKQSEFASKCRDLFNSYLSGWGCYFYYVPFQAKIPNGEFKNRDFKVWQLFCEAYTSNQKNEYDLLFPSWRKNRENLPSFRNGTRTFITSVYNKILSFIDKLNELYPQEIQVILANSNNDDKDNSLIDKHFAFLKEQLSNRKIRTSTFTKSPLSVEEKVHYVVIELITNNSHLSNVCDSLLSIKKGCYRTCIKSYKNTCFSNIVYITLLKEYDEDEADKLVAKEKEKIRKAEEEQQRKEAEIARKAEEARKEAERKRAELNGLISCTTSWTQPTRSSVHCFSIYNYYPTTCDWDASEDEWNVRNLIWDFKANPNKPQSEIEIKNRHERAVNGILPKINRVLNRFFGNQKSKLTLVCIPSSKRIVTERRYKDFSEQLCNETGMTNGYSHVYIAEEGDAAHLGGVVQAQFSVDSSFFKDKYVILFDDVITSGKSMERFKRLLESVGATVIGGLSIGKTKHERQSSNPIDNI